MFKIKAFTLAEILIVIAVIGLIAAVTIPVILRGVIEKQWRSSYQKAYNTVSNVYMSEHTSGNLPNSNDENSVLTMFKAMNSYMTIKDYAKPSTEEKIISEALYDNSDYYNSISFNNDSSDSNSLYVQKSVISPWIITEDNMAYCVVVGKGCSTKESINSSGNHNNAVQNSCVLVVVDVNGLNNGPNRIEPQILSADQLNETDVVDILTRDSYYIYVGLNGVSSGSKQSTVTGRIVSDLK